MVAVSLGLVGRHVDRHRSVVTDRYHGSIEFCGTCDTGHEWDGLGERWQARADLRLARLETD
jgi:hypothetical protein